VWRRHPADRVHHGARADPEILRHPGKPLEPPPGSLAGGPPTDQGELMQATQWTKNIFATTGPLNTKGYVSGRPMLRAVSLSTAVSRIQALIHSKNDRPVSCASATVFRPMSDS